MLITEKIVGIEIHHGGCPKVDIESLNRELTQSTLPEISGNMKDRNRTIIELLCAVVNTSESANYPITSLTINGSVEMYRQSESGGVGVEFGRILLIAFASSSSRANLAFLVTTHQVPRNLD